MDAWIFVVVLIPLVFYIIAVLANMEDYIDDDGYFDESYKPVENKDILWDELQIAIQEEVEKNKKQQTFVKCEYCDSTNKTENMKCTSCGAPLIKL